MRYDSAHDTRRSPLARAKNTERSAARRRARAAARAQLLAADTDSDDIGEDVGESAPEPRQPFFTPPRFREDVRLLPQIFRSRRALWIPVVLLAVGFFATLAFYRGWLPESLAAPVELYIQFFFFPQALFTFFLAGFLAPRASYLIGFLLGLLNGVLWTILILGMNIAVIAEMDPVLVAGNFLVIGVVYGTLSAAFAAWYRNFLRRMSNRSRASRAQREAQDRARRRDERRAARRPTG